MKLVIIADIHATFAALKALPEPFDELWVVGDLVNFGPKPAEVVDWVRNHAHCVVRGNDDHAVGYRVDLRCITAYQKVAAEAGEYSASMLSEEKKQYLRLLPLTTDRVFAGARSHLCHANPSDPLFGYLERDTQDWESEVASTRSDVVVVGHTHVPSLRSFGKARLVNPGSLAGLKVTNPQASYSLWEDGRIQLKRYSYAVEEAVAEIGAMPVSQTVQERLSELITTSDLMVGRV